jgi:hypothetical protein
VVTYFIEFLTKEMLKTKCTGKYQESKQLLAAQEGISQLGNLKLSYGLFVFR